MSSKSSGAPAYRLGVIGLGMGANVLTLNRDPGGRGRVRSICALEKGKLERYQAEYGVETSEKAALSGSLSAGQLAGAAQRVGEIKSTLLQGLPPPPPKPAARIIEAKPPAVERPVAAPVTAPGPASSAPTTRPAASPPARRRA